MNPAEELKAWSRNTIYAVHAQLNDESSDLAADLAPCGIETLRKLRTLTDPSARLGEAAEVQCYLDEIISEAYARMKAPQTDLPKRHWYRLYSEASLLWALLQCALTLDYADEVFVRAISKLDHAIVIAGAPGEGRLDFILDAIGQIQKPCAVASWNDTGLCLDEPQSANQDDLLPLSSSSRTVPNIEAAPSLAVFQGSYGDSPFVIRGFASDWPAIAEGRWRSLDYLQCAGGPGRVVPVEVGGDYRTDEWTQTMMGWAEYLDYLTQKPPKTVMYLAQHDLFNQFSQLRWDVIIPDYVYASLPAPPYFTQYRPPANDEQLVMNAWLGPAGTISPAHMDPYFNFYVQVVGHKTVWLAPPHLSHAMSPLSTSTAPQHPAANQRNLMMSNTSSIDVFGDLACAIGEHSNEGMFRNEVVPHAMSVRLEPGDMLFFPPGWWHAMRSDSVSFSVSFWF